MKGKSFSAKPCDCRSAHAFERHVQSKLPSFGWLFTRPFRDGVIVLAFFALVPLSFFDDSLLAVFSVAAPRTIPCKPLEKNKILY